jgi:hypothetical protein
MTFKLREIENETPASSGCGNGIASWEEGGEIHFNCVFTWHLPKLLELAELANESGKKAVAHGEALKIRPDFAKEHSLDFQELEPDFYFRLMKFHMPQMSMSTIGCPMGCEYCNVPKISGDLRIIESWKPSPVLMDSNLLAAPEKHVGKVVDALKRFDLAVISNLDARFFSPRNASRLSELKMPAITFAFDSMRDEIPSIEALRLAKKTGFEKIQSYCLINFGEDVETTEHRLDLIAKEGAIPIPLRFEGDGLAKGGFLENGWSEEDIALMEAYWLGSPEVRELMGYEEFKDRMEAAFE